jgi:hypothetical protein
MITQLIEMYGGPRDGARYILAQLPDIFEVMLSQSAEAKLHQPPIFVKAIYERTKRVTTDGVVKYYFQREEVMTVQWISEKKRAQKTKAFCALFGHLTNSKMYCTI